MATIRPITNKDGSRVWKARVRLGQEGRLVDRSKRFRRKVDAQRWAAKVETEAREYRAFGVTRRTVAEAIDRYVASELPELALSSQRPRRAQLRWWRERLGRYMLHEVTPDLIAQHRDSLGCSPATRNRYLAALRRVWTVAMKRWHWTDRSPAHLVATRREPEGRVRYLSSSEREALLQACRRSLSATLYPLVVLALTTGARQQELMALRWQLVDLDRQVAYVLRSKNRQRRQLALAQWSIEVLREYGEHRGHADRVFPGSFPRTAFEHALVVSGIEDFRWHDLRHTWASYMAMSGASLLEIQHAGGWKTAAMVNRYAHLSPAHVSDVVRRVDFRGLQVG